MRAGEHAPAGCRFIFCRRGIAEGPVSPSREISCREYEQMSVITSSQRAPRPVMVESLLFASICLCDLILTLWLLQTGAAIEANPILRFYYELGIQWFALVKGAFSLVPIFVLEVIALRRRRFVQ